MRKLFCLSGIAGTLAFLLSLCSFSCQTDTTEIKIATWNVQTFFDTTTEGSEYSEFQKSEKWTEEAYKTRLVRLCEGLKKLDAEVYVLEEIENENIIYDISNMLAGNAAWNKKKKLNYATFAKDEGGSIGMAVLSRLVIENISVHALDIRTEKESQPQMRPVLEMQVHKGDNTITIFANHWKSKSGGAEKSEIWRLWQESVLADRLINLNDTAAIACGDFNKDIADFNIYNYNSHETGSYIDASQIPNVFLQHKNFYCQESVAVFSPWLYGASDIVNAEKGSYFFRDNWERIDHFFAFGAIQLQDFEAVATEPFANSEGIPIRYTLFNGKGVSDHLPLICTIKLTDAYSK